MQLISTELATLGRILVVGLVLGAGLPVLFSAGVRAWAWGAGGDAETHPAGAPPAPHRLGTVLAVVCFAVVLACVALGVTYVVASGSGATLDLSHGWPRVVTG